MNKVSEQIILNLFYLEVNYNFGIHSKLKTNKNQFSIKISVTEFPLVLQIRQCFSL